MATGFPAVTGDVMTAGMFNGLVAFTLNAQTGTSYTAISTDQYQVLVTMNNAAANTFNIPTDATLAFPNGTAITILQIGAGVTTIQAATPGTTTVTSAGATSAAPVLARYKAAVALKTGTNAWTIIGAVA
jgi:hypothetical protein